MKLKIQVQYIYVRSNTPFYTASRKIVVSKPTKSYLNITRGTNAKIQPLIVGFSSTWDIKTKYGWSVYSPNVGIIKVDQDHYKGTIKVTALNDGILYTKGTPGLT